MKTTKHPKGRFLFFCPWGNCPSGIIFGAIVWGTIILGATLRFQSSREQFSVCACVWVCACVCLGGGGGWGTIIRGTNFIGINYPWGKLSKGQYFGSQSSRGGAIAQVAIIREAIFLGRKCLGCVMDV